MSFNPNPTKQAEQIIFSTKASETEHPAIYFNGSEVETVPHHKYIGLILDEALNFAEHIKEAIIKARRGIAIVRFLSKYVHRDVLDQMYKLYVRPHLGQGDVVCHNQNSSLMSRSEFIQYAAALAVSGAFFSEAEQLSHLNGFLQLPLYSKNFHITGIMLWWKDHILRSMNLTSRYYFNAHFGFLSHRQPPGVNAQRYLSRIVCMCVK